MNLKKLITILLVLTFLVQPVLAAEGKAAMGESLKEPALVSKGIENAPAELKGKISVRDSNVSQYHIKATDNGISIKADLDKKDHTRELTVSRQALEKMKGFDGSRFYAHHFEDDGTYTGYQEVHIGKSQQVTFTVQFSEVLLSSFSGYYEVTQTLSSGQSLTVPAGADRIVVYINGTIPESIAYEDV